MDSKYLDRDFYQIIEYDNEKYIKIDGFYYESENTTKEPDGKCVSISGLEYKLDDFIAIVKGNKNFRIDEIDLKASQCKQFISDVNLNDISNYYNDSVIELAYENLTKEVAFGNYVDV